MLPVGAQALVSGLNIVLFLLVASVLAPRLAEVAWPRRTFGWRSRIALAGVLIATWHGYVAYPLADFPALVATLGATVILYVRRSPTALLAAGLLAGLAVNIRPAYVLVPLVLVLLAVGRWRGGELHRPALGLSLLIAGILLVSLPQSLIAYRHFDQLSPLPGTAWELSDFQLRAGLELQRYETNVGNEYPVPGMRYVDPATDKILHEHREIEGYGDYLSIALDEPLTMVGVWARRVVNGLDARYPTAYVEDIDPSRALRFLNFTLIFLALLRLAWPHARRRLGDARWGVFAPLVAAVVVTPTTAIETRFMLPLYGLAYLLALAPGWPNPFRRGASRQDRLAVAGVIVTYVGFMAGAWLIVRETTKNLTPPPL